MNSQVRRSSFQKEKLDLALVTSGKHTRQVRDGADCQAEVEKVKKEIWLRFRKS